MPLACPFFLCRRGANVKYLTPEHVRQVLALLLALPAPSFDILKMFLLSVLVYFCQVESGCVKVFWQCLEFLS
jgi:hypothetical protein